MAMTERRRSIGSMLSQPSRDNLTAPGARARSKGPESSAISIAGSDKSTDGALDKFRSRNDSEDGRSDTSSTNRTRMSKLFKGLKKSKGGNSQDDLSQHDSSEALPPVPAIREPAGDARSASVESLPLAKSVASSLLTEDFDKES